MAWRLRIRHKLAVGFVLALGVLGLMAAGAGHGLVQYRATLRAISGRLAERKAAQQLHDALEALRNFPVVGDLPPSGSGWREHLAAARAALTHYEQHLEATILFRRDGETGYDEQGLVARLAEGLDQLEQKTSMPAGVVVEINPAGSLWDTSWRGHLHQLCQLDDGLRDAIDSDLSRLLRGGDAQYRFTRLIVIGLGCLGGLLLLVLTRLAYRGIVGPVRELYRQTRAVAEGHFDGRVAVQSGDELQELGDAFNAMTARLQAVYRDLERQVNERSRQLIRSERLAGVGFLAAGVAHEINNPLASISFCSEALERRLAGLLDRHPGDTDVTLVRRYLEMIQQEAFRCKEITQKLLEFSRVGEQQRQMTDLAELVQSVTEMLAHLPAYQDKQVRFQAVQRPHLPLSAHEIKSVVLNLMVNALESMDGAGTLTVTLTADAEQAILTFADTGCGMTPEVLDNLFEPFFTRSRTGKGIGLGLSISHRIVVQHGGEIEATSPGPGQGSTFTVRLPLRPPAAAAPPPAGELPVRAA